MFVLYQTLSLIIMGKIDIRAGETPWKSSFTIDDEYTGKDIYVD